MDQRGQQGMAYGGRQPAQHATQATAGYGGAGQPGWSAAGGAGGAAHGPQQVNPAQIHKLLEENARAIAELTQLDTLYAAGGEAEEEAKDEVKKEDGAEEKDGEKADGDAGGDGGAASSVKPEPVAQKDASDGVEESKTSEPASKEPDFPDLKRVKEALPSPQAMENGAPAENGSKANGADDKGEDSVAVAAGSSSEGKEPSASATAADATGDSSKGASSSSGAMVTPKSDEDEEASTSVSVGVKRRLEPTEEVQKRRRQLLNGLRRRLMVLSAWADLPVSSRDQQLKKRPPIPPPPQPIPDTSGGDGLPAEAEQQLPRGYGQPGQAVAAGGGPGMHLLHASAAHLAAQQQQQQQLQMQQQHQHHLQQKAAAAAAAAGMRPGASQPAQGFMGQQRTSRYRGVSLQNGKWTAQITAKNQQAYLGRYHTEEEAANAILRAEAELRATGHVTLPRKTGDRMIDFRGQFPREVPIPTQAQREMHPSMSQLLRGRGQGPGRGMPMQQQQQQQQQPMGQMAPQPDLSMATTLINFVRNQNPSLSEAELLAQALVLSQNLPHMAAVGPGAGYPVQQQQQPPPQMAQQMQMPPQQQQLGQLGMPSQMDARTAAWYASQGGWQQQQQLMGQQRQQHPHLGQQQLQQQHPHMGQQQHHGQQHHAHAQQQQQLLQQQQLQQQQLIQQQQLQQQRMAAAAAAAGMNGRGSPSGYPMDPNAYRPPR